MAPVSSDTLPGIKALLAVLEWLLMAAGQPGLRGALGLLFNLSRRTVKSYCRRERKDQIDTFLLRGKLWLPGISKCRCPFGELKINSHTKRGISAPSPPQKNPNSFWLPLVSSYTRKSHFTALRELDRINIHK